MDTSFLQHVNVFTSGSRTTVTSTVSGSCIAQSTSQSLALKIKLWKFMGFSAASLTDRRGNGCQETTGRRWYLKNTNESKQLPPVGLKCNALSAVRLDYYWEAPGSVQISSLKTSTTANSCWKCLSQKCVPQSICRSLWPTQGNYQAVFPILCLSLTFVGRLLLW